MFAFIRCLTVEKDYIHRHWDKHHFTRSMINWQYVWIFSTINKMFRLASVALLLFSWRIRFLTSLTWLIFSRDVWWSWYAVSLLHLGLGLSNTMVHGLAYDLSRYVCHHNLYFICEPSSLIHLKLTYACYWQVFVANHTSMIDFIVLEQMTAFAVIMQKHPGWVGKILLYLHWLLFHFVSLSKVAEPWYEDMYINNQTLIYHHAMEHFWKLRPNYTFNILTSSFWIRTYNSVIDSRPGCWIGILQILVW